MPLGLLVACGIAEGCKQRSDAGASTSASVTASGPASASASSSAGAASADHRQLARAFVQALGEGRYDEARKTFGAEMAKAIDEQQLAQVWISATASGGAFDSVSDANATPVGDNDRVVVSVKLANGTVDVSVVYPRSGAEIVGLHIGEVVSPYAAPAYVDATKFTATEVNVGEGALALPATLCTPSGAGPFPIVLLVHGSGPGDRDESIGPSKPFRDLAEGLASRGVAVLRWEKRTHGHVAALAMDPTALTIKEEYLDDVAAAIKLARATPSIDPARVFIVGHSQGGMMMPKLLALDPKLRGGVSMSGNARRFEDAFVPQYEYLAKATGQADVPLAKQQIEDMRKRVARVKDPALSESTKATDLPLDVPPKYWLSLRGYDQVATAKTLPQPLLFLQGGRDYQVTEAEDLALWKKGLAGKTNATFKVYPKLNHAYFAGEGTIGPAEYLTLGHVDAQVIDDLVAFVGAAR